MAWIYNIGLVTA